MNPFDDLFEAACVTAVKATLEEARKQDAQPSAEELRATLDSEREALTSGLGDDYRETAARVPADGPLLRIARPVVLLLCAAVTAATCLLYGWTTATGLTSSGSTLAGAGVALLVLLLAGLLVSGAAWLVWRRVPAGGPPDAMFLAPVALTSLVTTGGLTFLSYQAGGAGWAVLALAVAGGVWAAAFAATVRTWWLSLVSPRAAARDRERLEVQRRLAMDELVEAMLQVLRPHVKAAAERLEATRLSVHGTLSLKRVRGEGHVGTPAEERLEKVAGGMDDGSIALSGPRGVGKTELLTAYCEEATRLSVVVVAPVLYDRRDFALHLFAEVCKRVMEDGPRPLRRPAGQHLRQIWYLQTHAAEAALNVPGVGLSLRRGRNRARQPLSYPEIVHDLKEFLRRVGLELAAPRRLVIGIDELDRIQPATAAQDFLNELKVIFDVPGCLFLLSVSDEALRAADLAPVGGRDVFDSAIDEVVRVEPLRQEDAERLLAKRVIGLPTAFTALFNALAGGIPRDLLRIARAAILFAERTHDEELPDTARRLVARELDRIVGSGDSRIPAEALGIMQEEFSIEYGRLRELGEQVADLTIANRLFFLDTVLGVFSADLTAERVQAAVAERSFAALARAGSRIGNADHQARAVLCRIREHWRLEPIPPSDALE
ncbi:AAA family ATPase [Nonomuraea insulae]|uniref:AAA family ATPase n=1 Tax=Nonomuraea insulae TaxID=1616787 RepID=A0ABW1CXK4_9ACTN